MKRASDSTEQRGASRRESSHDGRYPEEEIIDALREEGQAGEELAEQLRAITGRSGRTSGGKG